MGSQRLYAVTGARLSIVAFTTTFGVSLRAALKMLRFAITLILTLATSARTVQERPNYSVASESQIKLALENNYEDTGPGAKGREYAYNTYKTLEEALVSYIDDPDTKLPESERMKALNRLITTPKEYERYTAQPIRELPKSVADYTGYRQIPQIAPIVLKKNVWPQSLYSAQPSTKLGSHNLGFSTSSLHTGVQHTTQPVYKFEGAPISDPALIPGPLIPGYFPFLAKVNHHREYNRPQYSTYGIYDKFTPDNAVHESTVGPVRGYYNFVDASGNQRTIHYNGDDKSGAQAIKRHQGINH
ncbi:unnamed protein product, partial [Iphiclides podalirius]